METLEQEHQQSRTTTDDRLAKKAKISVPIEIIEEILSRLPVESIIRFRSVSKPWLSRISHPSFTKLHSTRSTRSALFFSAYDSSTRQHHILSAATHGGPVTHLFTVDDVSVCHIKAAEHLNGLVLIGSAKSRAYVVNPSTQVFSVINFPQGALLDDDDGPCIIKTKGCIGIFRRIGEKNEIHVWILQDYDKRVWVREIYTGPLTRKYSYYPEDFVNMDEIICFPSQLSENVMSLPVYNRKSGCFKSLQFTLGHLFPVSRNFRFYMVRSYDESMVPL
ncbi:putative F-box domain-containing protein [Helianthus annuus]|nr:putative F-box domain-containing protein [Helianthus annuus]